jgi:murein DD-endopeptidase MepM/ murein hydrolase activator NlpD
MTFRRVLGRLFTLALLFAFLVLAYPYLKNATRFVGLLREPPPTTLPVPVDGVSRSGLADTWGAARSGGRTHEGIDIFAPRGTQVLSATRGIVVRKGWNRLGGKVVTVLGPGGWHHYYAHLDDWADPARGDWVERGTVLGYVGTTGNAQGTPPHLHYGLYDSGEARNPYPLLTRREIDSPAP